ncbi:unnamed protein product, partial [Heterotrigona itama]
ISHEFCVFELDQSFLFFIPTFRAKCVRIGFKLIKDCSANGGIRFLGFSNPKSIILMIDF